jgi:RNA polymerase sigma-70 factor, ECF subfamily
MKESFDRFYQRHLGLVRAMALARTGDAAQADDLTQETMLSAWRSFATLQDRDDSGQRAWLLTALRHRAIESWRRAKPAEPLLAAEAACDDNPALRLDIARALMALSHTDRELIVLRYFEQCDATEIGAILSLPPGTVRRRLGEARRRLETALEAWRTR